MTDMVRKHTVEGTGNHRTICDIIERTREMLSQSRHVSRSFVSFIRPSSSMILFKWKSIYDLPRLMQDTGTGNQRSRQSTAWIFISVHVSWLFTCRSWIWQGRARIRASGLLVEAEGQGSTSTWEHGIQNSSEQTNKAPWHSQQISLLHKARNSFLSLLQIGLGFL